MAVGDPLSIGVSGLLAMQRALATTSHNIANANTPGYSRQETELVTRVPELSSEGAIGTGVRTTTVRRAYDSFLTEQVRNRSSEHAMSGTFHALASQINNLFADPEAGLSPALQGFFNAAQEVADDPSVRVPRQALLTEAEGVAARFHFLDNQLQDLNETINRQVGDTVAEINSLSASIGDLNQRIRELGGQNGSQPVNDLLDRRDQLIRELSQKVAVNVFPQDDGGINVFVGNGQALVVGDHSRQLTTINNPYDRLQLEIGYATGKEPTNISKQITGGELEALLTFREAVLEPSRRALGQLALGVTQTFNTQHRLGMDLNGELGGDFFSPIDKSASTALPRADNKGDGVVEITVSDVSKLTDSNYRLDREESGYTLTRLADNKTFALSPFPSDSTTVDGLTLNLTSGTIAAGDSYLIRPTQGAAQRFETALTDPARVAAAAPLRGEANLENAGTAQISADLEPQTDGLPLSSDEQITLSYNAAARQFSVSGGPGGTLHYDPATDSDGKTFTFSSLGGVSFTISGTPSDGDTLHIYNNTGSVSDNRNALALAELQSTPTLRGETETYQEHYSSLVGDVGARTRQAEANQEAHKALLNQAIGSMEGVSGVNLDEEAANLLRFQQAYQASARVISTADTLFQTLLGAIGR